jgi:hypothetical protein
VAGIEHHRRGVPGSVLLGLAQHRLERQVEKRIQWLTDDVGGADAELRQGVATGAQHPTIGVHRDDALVQGADEFRPGVEHEQPAAGKLVDEDTIFDFLHRHVDQIEYMARYPVGFTGRIQHGQNLAAPVEDRRRRTGQAGVAE